MEPQFTPLSIPMNPVSTNTRILLMMIMRGLFLMWTKKVMNMLHMDIMRWDPSLKYSKVEYNVIYNFISMVDLYQLSTMLRQDGSIIKWFM